MTAFLSPKKAYLNLSCTQNRPFLCMFYVSCTRFAHFLCMSYQSCTRNRVFLCKSLNLLMFKSLGEL
jgi:hypothetical protein